MRTPAVTDPLAIVWNLWNDEAGNPRRSLGNTHWYGWADVQSMIAYDVLPSGSEVGRRPDHLMAAHLLTSLRCGAAALIVHNTRHSSLSPPRWALATTRPEQELAVRAAALWLSETPHQRRVTPYVRSWCVLHEVVYSDMTYVAWRATAERQHQFRRAAWSLVASLRSTAQELSA